MTRKKRVLHTDLRKFSGKSWQDLEDIWPAPVRISSEAWKVLSVIMPAWENLKVFIKSEFGFEVQSGWKSKDPLVLRHIILLAWIQRCEEARSNVGAHTMPMSLGNISVVGRQIHDLLKFGFVEKYPYTGSKIGNNNIRCYRVAPRGKILLRMFVKYLEDAHNDVHAFTGGMSDATRAKVDKYFSTYCFDWKELDLKP